MRIRIVSRGPFSLRAAAEFGFGPNEGRPPPFDGVLRYAFGVDGAHGYAGAALRQAEPHGPVTAEVETDADPAIVERQLARVLSLDHDGERFMAVGARDPVVARLQAAHPGQRPVLFHSPYEAAAWSVISARRSARQGAAVRAALSEQLGRGFELAGQTVHALPRPEHLLAAGPQPGLQGERLERLHGVARAALAGRLDPGELQRIGAPAALERVRGLRGIGPFYAGLIVLRGTGFADAILPTAEPRVLGHAARLYGLDGPLGLDRFARLAEPWRPFRTWVTVLIRMAGDRGTV